MAHIEKRITKKGIERWRVQIRLKEFPSVDKHFDTEAEAISFAEQTESNMKLSKKADSIQIPKLPFKVWVSRWKEEIEPTRNNATREKKYMEFWEKEMGDYIANDISPVAIESAADNLYLRITRFGTPMSHESRRKYLMWLSSLYTVAMKNWKWCIYNPLTGVNLVKKEKETSNLLEENIDQFDEFKKHFRERVQQEMDKKGMFQRRAASLCDMSFTTFQNVIHPQGNPTLKLILKVCNAFGIKLRIE